ncbi:unnamed protein product [Cuscuta epithymum]|uniref:KIB1-4 beta-propeller domain-containing protein n=1 Tax=Cuscuta epithymum TaxID=186058 RepID=A0AAV0CWV3_9ASTE|nr:unnamed protein product [Cuscuta epithymum]
MIMYVSQPMRGRLAFFRNEDQEWTDVGGPGFTTRANMTYHNGRFYAIYPRNDAFAFLVFEIEISKGGAASFSTRTRSFKYDHYSMCVFFWMVGSSQGRLMLVCWSREREYESSTNEFPGFIDLDVPDESPPFFEGSKSVFVVEEIEFESGKSKKVNNFMEDQALFLGKHSSSFVRVCNQSIFKPNHIYFTLFDDDEDSFCCRVGLYNLDRRTSEQMPNTSLYVDWIEPSF